MLIFLKRWRGIISNFLIFFVLTNASAEFMQMRLLQRSALVWWVASTNQIPRENTERELPSETLSLLDFFTFYLLRNIYLHVYISLDFVVQLLLHSASHSTSGSNKSFTTNPLPPSQNKMLCNNELVI